MPRVYLVYFSRKHEVMVRSALNTAVQLACERIFEILTEATVSERSQSNLRAFVRAQTHLPLCALQT